MACAHRPTGRWGRWWTAWLGACLGSFAVAEAAALVTEGTPATLSAYLRRAAGLDPPCRHSHVGRGLILTAFGWCAAHLAFGVLGIEIGHRE